MQMHLDLSILYRGPLSGCNYDCAYCPFAKHHQTAQELATDRRALERFVDWIAVRPNDRFSILFTPWGEALVRRWYQNAFVRLSHFDHVHKVAIQTNLSCRLDWLEHCKVERLGLWCSYHPTQTTRAEFLEQCQRLDEVGVRYSVGVVGLRESYHEIELLRSELRSGVYLWINAYKDQAEYYSDTEVTQLTSIDPLFPINNQHHSSVGRACQTGETVISVDGDGNITRCHFIKQKLGNIYEPGFEEVLEPRPCTNGTCGCHIGYVHMPELNLYETFEDGMFERIPTAYDASWNVNTQPIGARSR